MSKQRRTLTFNSGLKFSQPRLFWIQTWGKIIPSQHQKMFLDCNFYSWRHDSTVNWEYFSNFTNLMCRNVTKTNNMAAIFWSLHTSASLEPTEQVADRPQWKWKRKIRRKSEDSARKRIDLKWSVRQIIWNQNKRNESRNSDAIQTFWTNAKLHRRRNTMYIVVTDFTRFAPTIILTGSPHGIPFNETNRTFHLNWGWSVDPVKWNQIGWWKRTEEPSGTGHLVELRLTKKCLKITGN